MEGVTGRCGNDPGAGVEGREEDACEGVFVFRSCCDLLVPELFTGSLLAPERTVRCPLRLRALSRDPIALALV